MASPAWAAGTSGTALPPSAPPARKLTAIDSVGGIFCHICQSTLGQKKEFDSHYLTHNTGTEVITYTCVACKIQLNNYPSFRGHCYNHHVIKDKYTCKHCNKFFSKLSYVKEHINAIHNFKCNKPSCNKQFPTKNELYLHQVIHKSQAVKPPYPCRTCNILIDSVTVCEDHIDTHCVFTYLCPICDEKITKENAIKHLIQHFNDEVLNTDDVTLSKINETPEDSSIIIVGGILCCYCKQLFKNRNEIDLHFSEEHPDKNILYSCNICDKQYKKYHLFGDHCYYHYSKGRFVCEFCDKRFPRLSLLVRHAEEHVAVGGARLSCSHCPRTFTSPHRLRDHQRRIHAAVAITCPEPDCQQVFETTRKLFLHCKYHKATPQRWCQQCGLQFPSLASAVKHLEVHKKKQFMCPVCAREYGEKYLLMKHIPQHFEEVFHMCKFCGKLFNAKNRLVEHAKIHTSVKTLECEFCGKAFFKPYQLSQHLNIHTAERPYKCVACPKAFAGLPNLKKHMRRMHNLEHKIRRKSEGTDNVEPSISQNELKIDNSGTEDSNSREIKKTYEFCSDESTMDSVTINSMVVEQEAQNYDFEVKSLASDSYTMAELTPILPELTDQLIAGAETVEWQAVPPEYGPDFLEEPLLPLPHVAPQLVSSRLQPALGAAFEPTLVTKVCADFFDYMDDVTANKFSIINTDIF